jgi:uncharacterized protein YjbJ (UPF0337 family)
MAWMLMIEVFVMLRHVAPAGGVGKSVGKQKEQCMNRDELEGKAEALKGKVKQAAGNATNDPDLHDEGVADEAAGNTQDALGRGRRKVGEAVRDIGNAIKK